MKRLLLATATIATILATGAIVNAGPGNIKWTVHNMSKESPLDAVANRHFKADNVDEICVFCHTPHNAAPSVPLWNKVLPTQAFRMYTSSATLSQAAKGAGKSVAGGKAPNTESLFCLSCHDGLTAVNVLHNSKVYEGTSGTDKVVQIGGMLGDPSNPTGAFSMTAFGFPINTYRANIGKGEREEDAYVGNFLMDDHPISFSYTAAQSEKTDKLNDLTTVSTKSGGKIRFFGSDNRIECSSCHDPHVDYGYDWDGNDSNLVAGHNPPGDHALRPFLAMDNASSAMCLACHNK